MPSGRTSPAASGRGPMPESVSVARDPRMGATSMPPAKDTYARMPRVQCPSVSTSPGSR